MKTIMCPLTEEELEAIEKGNYIVKEYGSNPFIVYVIHEKFNDVEKMEDEHIKIIENTDCDLLICPISDKDIKILKNNSTVISHNFDDGEIEVAIMNENDFKKIQEELK